MSISTYIDSSALLRLVDNKGDIAVVKAALAPDNFPISSALTILEMSKCG